MYNRPKIDIPKTTFEKAFDIITSVLFIGWIVYLIYIWGQLPAQVPAHFNGAGEVDRLGSKWELIILPLIAIIMTPFLAFLEKHPEWHNYMNLTEDNIEFQYKNSRMLLNVVKNESVLFLAYISVQSSQVALGNASSLGFGFLPTFIIILFGSMAFFIVRSVKNK
ncbi:DUF1648 domain-containing protein [Sporosarcina sp. Sa2YVA2]|uniref:DUF1648 domain-containing protein n=1 Tax=Sporosarcina quadrami TaxID=2762234 RepID=A0ABR8U8T5_9BACL|nr:DUF1648 domain-containing protein [Sporosarcina quadrami]MBD7984133.1 DUF1648 domain-containing protein [Sporosarcina quadrami]